MRHPRGTADADPVILEVALNGATGREQNPHVPRHGRVPPGAIVAVLGGDVVGCGLARLALERGGHLRVGLEDHAGDRRPANLELLDEAVSLVAALGRRPATGAEARALLGVPV